MSKLTGFKVFDQWNHALKVIPFRFIDPKNIKKDTKHVYLVHVKPPVAMAAPHQKPITFDVGYIKFRMSILQIPNSRSEIAACSVR